MACAALLLCGAVDAARATAWVQRKGHGIVIVQHDRWDGTSGFANDHQLFRFPYGGNSYVNQTNVYAEYGVTDRLTVIGNFWLNEVGYKNIYSSQSNFGFGDQEVGVRYKVRPLGFLPAPWVGAVQLLVGMPTYNVNAAQRLGPGGESVEIRHAIGRPYRLLGRWSYIDMSGGIRFRTGQAAHELRFDATHGTTLWYGFTVMEEFSHIQSLNNGLVYNSGNPIGSTNYDLTKFRASLLKRLGPVSIQAGYERDLAGRNTGAGGGPFVGLWIPFGGPEHWAP
ncbi:conserved hypothetical protein [Gluconacetobacter diazotrophicus PA1 5]|uniref:Uncharacterized protein n=2 Tax=Gluconacetobacter diazotrophicus TaxID=33996 RepID=A9H4R5_GLUDA|nr:conserved hypothetical protein [Gluconacetobacter diazotrophicus PA1 5]